jgi:hypothetical protein
MFLGLILKLFSLRSSLRSSLSIYIANILFFFYHTKERKEKRKSVKRKKKRKKNPQKRNTPRSHTEHLSDPSTGI